MKLLMAFIFAAALLALPFAASAGDLVDGQVTQNGPRPNSCVPHKIAVDQLADKFDEKVVGLGLGNGRVR